MQVRTGRHGLAPFVGWNGVAVVEEATPARVLAAFVVPVAFPGSLGTVGIVEGPVHACSVSRARVGTEPIPPASAALPAADVPVGLDTGYRTGAAGTLVGVPQQRPSRG